MEACAWKSYQTTRLDLALDARKGKHLTLDGPISTPLENRRLLAYRFFEGHDV
jgi:hypothetical protein